MAQFEIEWTMTGRAIIEADDVDESELILQEGLANLDASMFDEFDVNDVSTDSAERVDE